MDVCWGFISVTNLHSTGTASTQVAPSRNYALQSDSQTLFSGKVEKKTVASERLHHFRC